MKEDGFCAIVAPAAARNYPRRQKVRLLTDRSLNVSSDRTQMLRHTFLLAHAHVYTHTCLNTADVWQAESAQDCCQNISIC